MSDEANPHIIPFPGARDTPVRKHEARPLGLLAGGGMFPVEFARAARRSGHKVCALGVTRAVSGELTRVCDSYGYVPIWRIGRAIRRLHRAGVKQLVMAGRIERGVLFHPFRWLRMLPDYRSWNMWLRYRKYGRCGNPLLLSVVREFEKDGFHFVSALDYAPELLVKHGFLTSRKPTAAQWHDIQYGWRVARELSRMNIGQTVAVHDGAILAVEAIEGTDNCIKRAGDYCPRGGFTVVKVPRHDQDRRFDVPVVGLETVKAIHQVGGRVLVVEADRTVIIDQEATTALADKFGIAIVAVNAEEISLHEAA